ncbi:MAG: UvrD-helicase domain-containing protein [Legionellaceae bacterium]|nr:UvrD-helicase domain-containing protein [Legionellaceae bacterium]
MLDDHKAREQAIDPKLSAVVQAPAGSGKTEILTQRFLRLLCTVDAPEHVVALTFTRKAAHEMRERILHALQQAQTGIQPTSPHQQTRYHDAQAVLARDNTLDWQVLNNPGRLRVTTLDSLCQSLVQAMPLQEKHVPYADVTDTPSKLYSEAARACLTYALNTAEYQQSIALLLEQLDNRVEHLLALFTEQLARRDQWIRPVIQARFQQKSHLEEALFSIEQHALNQFKQALPDDCATPLFELATEIARLENNPDSPRYILTQDITYETLDGQTTAALASLLLTSQNTFRKSCDHHVGLKRGVCPDARYRELKATSKALLETLRETPGFLDALLRVRALPSPCYPEAQWEPLQALLKLLPLLASHLQLIFQAHQTVDFSGIAHQALDALGEEDAPTDLALHLDYSIQHLLVDEFQDTSLQQFELITRLVRGFEPDDGRTLFIVGDPMQSIYRFRAAEVGLFLRAQREGIGAVHLTPLQLSCNFRSNKTLVEWSNRLFSQIFPLYDDVESGAVSFHPATPTQALEHQEQAVYAFEHEHADDEAEAIAGLCKQLLQDYTDENIAILVRSRQQLARITRALEAHHVTYQGLDTDLTITRPHVQDVWSLTQALLMPANRLAWLSVLRSPWCGLTLTDIHRIATYDVKQPIISALSQSACTQTLSPSGQVRIEFITHVLQHALATRHQFPLATWLMNTLTALHLDAILTPEEEQDLEQFWEKLARFEQDGQIIDYTLLKQELSKLYTKQLATARLQIMTIHKAKGLEFDSVILPGLGKRAPNPDKPLLRWLTLPSDVSADELILISPLQAAHHERCPLYDYLGQLDAEKSAYEQQRLLYVATTRAKARLYLFDSTTSVTKNTFRASLNTEDFTSIPSALVPLHAAFDDPVRHHLPDTFYSTSTSPILPEALELNTALPELTPARALGTIAHQVLEWICTYHPKTLHEVPWNIATHALNALGLSEPALNALTTQLKTLVSNMFHDKQGAWILKQHQDEQNEYALLVHENNRVSTCIIDRLFIENGLCWIIDFKTGQDETEQQQAHQKQLNTYAYHMHDHLKLPIRCGIYYLSHNRWVEWAWESTSRYVMIDASSSITE